MTNFKVEAEYAGNCKLPAIVKIRMQLVDSRSLKRIKANPGAKSAILENATKYEFSRVISIDRGQPKPKLKND